MFIDHTRDLALPLPCAPRGRAGADQRLDLVGGENSTERWLRVGTVSAKIPTSRKEREKWGTRRERPVKGIIRILRILDRPLQVTDTNGKECLACGAVPFPPCAAQPRYGYELRRSGRPFASRPWGSGYSTNAKCSRWQSSPRIVERICDDVLFPCCNLAKIDNQNYPFAAHVVSCVSLKHR
jgi:hypothetical protein